MKSANQESRLARWSRRKQQTTDETQKEDLVLELNEQGPPENEIQEALNEDQSEIASQEPVLSDADMEPVETLTENSDFSKFMSPGVSDELRNLALRKMFQAPFFNIRDGLDEYDEDYTTFEKLGDIVTADMRHQMEMEANRKLEEEAKKIAEGEVIPDQQDLDSDVEQTPSIATEDEIAKELDVDVALKDNEIPHQSADKMQQTNE